MSWIDVLKLVASLIICLSAGGIGAIFTTRAIPIWYRGLKKPGFTPPNSLFGPIWTILYILMGVAVFLVWREGLNHSGVPVAFSLFWVQLALNILWSIIFFGLRSLAGGMALIILLWIMILVTLILFFRVSAAAGGLLIPYLLWVTIASNLNLQIWRLNR
jgi:translocator protein